MPFFSKRTRPIILNLRASDPNNVKAVVNFVRPNVLQSFLGLVMYLVKFIPKAVTALKPLYNYCIKM